MWKEEIKLKNEIIKQLLDIQYKITLEKGSMKKYVVIFK